MKMVRDTTGRFRERPHYELNELEEECERTAFTFLEEQYGQVLIPIPTNALVVLIEQYAEDLDLFADLSGEGASVQGVTEFFTSGKPQVRIARELSQQLWRGAPAAHDAGPRIRACAAARAVVGAKRGGQRPTPVLAANVAAAKHHDGLDGVAGRLCVRRALDAQEQGEASG